MPIPGSYSRGARPVEHHPYETVEHWRETSAPFSGVNRPGKSPIKGQRPFDPDDVPFASEEVEAARIMYDAFRATKGPDGEVIDTDLWSQETEARVEVR